MELNSSKLKIMNRMFYIVCMYLFPNQFSNLDVGEQMEVVVSMVAGKKPGAYITIIGVATIQFTFKVFFTLLKFYF